MSWMIKSICDYFINKPDNQMFIGKYGYSYYSSILTHNLKYISRDYQSFFSVKGKYHNRKYICNKCGYELFITHTTSKITAIFSLDILEQSSGYNHYSCNQVIMERALS